MVHIIFASDSNEPPLDKQTIKNFARLVQLSKSISENDAVSDEGTESPLLDKIKIARISFFNHRLNLPVTAFNFILNR